MAEDAVAGVSLATIYAAVRPEAEVGGDFFDVIALPEARVALVLGDTCGKGLEAAVHNTHVKDGLRAFLRESPGHAGSILTRLNAVACDMLAALDAEQGYRFVVLSLLILEPGSGEIRYSSADAEPLLVVWSAGPPEVIERPALPLGIEREVFYEDTVLRLEPGDTAVMVTDGLTEARRGGELLGHPGMVRLAMDSLRAPSLQEAGEEILAGARTFAHGDLSDDVCFILARRR